MSYVKKLKICFLCSERGRKMISLQEYLSECKGLSMAQILQDLHFLTISDASNLDEAVCFICTVKIQTCFEFKTLCIHKENTLKNLTYISNKKAPIDPLFIPFKNTNQEKKLANGTEQSCEGNSIEFRPSEKGRPTLVLNDFMYFKDKQIDNKTYWKCEYFKTKKCKARVVTDQNNVQKKSGEHCHISDAAQLEVSKFLDKIRNSAKTTHDSPHNIISSHVPEINSYSALCLPKTYNISRTIRNIRHTNDTTPQSRSEIIFPDAYKQTINGDVFLQFDSGPIDSRIVIFGTHQSLKLLEKSNNWCLDGTLSTVPHLFEQLYIIYGFNEDYTIPLLYALLPAKTESTYVTFLQEVKNLCPASAPNSVLLDFEPAMINAVSIFFPEAGIRGSFFHFCQCVYRKIQSSNLLNQLNNDVEFAINIRMLNALAFVPVQCVEDAFNRLKKTGLIPVEAHPVLHYFQDTWIGHSDGINRRQNPTFPYFFWNYFDVTVSGLLKINNDIECHHKSFESYITKNHLNIWKFLYAIKKKHSFNESKIEQLVEGALSTTPKKKYKDCLKQILNILGRFDPIVTIQYLRDIALNISY